MDYRIDYLAEAIRDLNKLDPQIARRVVRKIDAMRVDMAGDVKRLTDYEPRYRLHRVVHRGTAYD